MTDLLKDLQGQRFRCIVADPPWQPTLHANNPRRKTLDFAGPQRFYPTMPVDEIAALPVAGCSAPLSRLWLWVINQHADWGYTVARAWGFEPEQIVTWCKPGLGVGRFMCNTEHMLVCRRGGRVGNPFGGGGQFAPAMRGTAYNWPRGRHSEKPEEAFALIEAVSPGPRLELFARRARLGWTVWGDEVRGSCDQKPKNVHRKCHE